MQHMQKEAFAHAVMIKGDEDDKPESIVAKAIGDFQKTVDERLKKVEEKSLPEDLVSRLEEVETKLARPGIIKASDDIPADVKAMDSYLRKGIHLLDDAEKKALNVGTPSAGGYVTSPEYSTKIIEAITKYAPMRSLATVMSTGSAKTYLPKMTTALNGGWTTETGTRTESQPVFDQDEIDVYEHAVIVPMSQQLIEDAFIDLTGYISTQIGKRFARAESIAFTNGDGNGKPTGFLKTPTNYHRVAAASNGTDILAKLIELFYDLDGEYAAASTWQMNRQTMGIIRAAADNATGRGTLWSDSLANGEPARFLGRPIAENPFMDDLASADSPPATTYPVALGDWATAYTILDRTAVEIMSDPYTGADSGIWKLRARKRVGAKTVQNDAIVLLESDQS